MWRLFVPSFSHRLIFNSKYFSYIFSRKSFYRYRDSVLVQKQITNSNWLDTLDIACGEL